MTTEPLRIPLAELRTAVDLLLRRLEAATVARSVPLDQDDFWSVPPDRLYDPTTEPDALTIGQLSASWRHLADLVADPDRAVGHHLVWLADVLRAIGLEHPG
ncbi:hypothetical protein [Kitasatospora camelliae]|uniref:Uncharacterized protein n=1 Tax=Kitasatospora camelliae TaxID=3156397 RepID=A0AAU8K769_9ACTN